MGKANALEALKRKLLEKTDLDFSDLRDYLYAEVEQCFKAGCSEREVRAALDGGFDELMETV